MTGLFSTKHRLPCPEKKELFAIDLSVDFLPEVKAPVAERGGEDRLLPPFGMRKKFSLGCFSLLSFWRAACAYAKVKRAAHTTIWKCRVQYSMNEYLFLPDSGQSFLNFQGGEDANPDGIHACQAVSKAQKCVRIGKIADSTLSFSISGGGRRSPLFETLPSVHTFPDPPSATLHIPTVLQHVV